MGSASSPIQRALHPRGSAARFWRGAGLLGLLRQQWNHHARLITDTLRTQLFHSALVSISGPVRFRHDAALSGSNHDRRRFTVRLSKTSLAPPQWITASVGQLR